MTEGAPLVLDLLSYIEQVEKLKTKPAFSVPTEYFVAYQHELNGLPELQFNLQSEGDDVWLRIPRLHEIAAPEPDAPLKPWIALPKNPDKTPELRTEIPLLDGKREVGLQRLDEHAHIKELFAWYVEYQWNSWAAAERPRRKTIARYNQLFALQQAIATDGAETPLELVWGMGYAVWKKENYTTPVKYPMLIQACEVVLNERTFDLEVRPRDVEPRLETDCYAQMELPGITQLDAFWRSAQASGANRVNPFEDSTFDSALKAAVGYLDPSGTYEVRTEDVVPPAPDGQLKITNTWVLFGRKRSGDIFLEDIRRLKKSVEAATSLPAVIRSFVERGDSHVRVNPEQPFRGLSTSDCRAGAMELFFPMPYNDEQVSIVQKLHANDGVVVQGPPGTGKTHTIANVICHYLAQGKRVLVTAKGESALAVLQEKLPEEVRPLSVSLLSDERGGMKQFEHSIQTIATRVSGTNPTRAAATIAAAEQKLNHLHAKIADIDQTISSFASQHMQHYSFQNREVTPEELAQLVIEHAEMHQWFDDEPPLTENGDIPFGADAIHALRHARLVVSKDLNYLGYKLPELGAFPAWMEILGLHRDLVKAQTIEASVAQGDLLALADSRLETFEQAQTLLQFLTERQSIKTQVEQASLGWVEAFAKRLAALQLADPVLQALLSIAEEVRELERQRKEYVAKAVQAPTDAELNTDFGHALERLVQGKSAFTLPLGKGVARKLIGATTVMGGVPMTQEDWGHVQSLMGWRTSTRKALARWNSLCAEFGLPDVEASLETGFRQLALWQETVEDLRKLTFDYNSSLRDRLSLVFGKNTADRVESESEVLIASAIQSLTAHVDKNRLAYARGRVQSLVQLLDGCQGGVVEGLRSFLTETLGKVDADEFELQNTWLTYMAELSRLVGLRAAFDAITRITCVIEAAGAPLWATRLRREPASSDLDPATPSNWMEAWHWRQAVMFLDSIDGHSRLRALFEERRTQTIALARTYQELVAEKTWLGVFHNSPNAVRQALQAYLNAIQAMGAGTGVRAIRHRKTAREAMTHAYQAVPCWVLPQWRVSETIPAEVGLFDLVIIDEASQSDIWALPALLRGRKVLVVGDHKQVSPSAIGTAEEKIKELMSRFLTEQPFGSEMTPDKSIYDLARVVFAGNSVMLKEHFRCVPAIIEFSNREFYQGDIRPLRVPKANERLDPPLMDVFVRGGYRKGDTNEPEARAIVAEIKAILADPAFDGRSIGVVTLLGTKQAALIHDLVNRQIQQADILARKIAIGPPPVFQGRERDIMMVSMVLGPKDRATANRADMHQRFNVALSRARDRMYLFRSVTDSEFGEDTLNGKVLSHFKQPFRQDAKKVEALRERCESGFEREMFDELVRRGYRVEPQVPCGGYRIDFVVEGHEGRRLAIECDGDRFHGPGQWQDDMARQRVLERAGWTFWRCFASCFVRRRNEILEDLLHTLEKLGIEPVGSESVDSTVWVGFKEVDPFNVGGAPEDGDEDEIEDEQALV